MTYFRMFITASLEHRDILFLFPFSLFMDVGVEGNLYRQRSTKKTDVRHSGVCCGMAISPLLKIAKTTQCYLCVPGSYV